MTQEELVDAAVKCVGSQTRLAELLGYNQGYISQLKSGKIKMRPAIESALTGIIEAPIPNINEDVLEQFIKFGNDTLATIRDYEKLNRSRFNMIATCAWINLAASILVAGLIIYGMK